MSTQTYTVRRDVTRRERIDEQTADGRYTGHRTIKIGEEICTMELTINDHKLYNLLLPKILRGQKRATVADGGVVLKVVKITPCKQPCPTS